MFLKKKAPKKPAVPFAHPRGRCACCAAWFIRVSHVACLRAALLPVLRPLLCRSTNGSPSSRTRLFPSRPSRPPMTGTHVSPRAWAVLCSYRRRVLRHPAACSECLRRLRR